jgi:amidase
LETSQDRRAFLMTVTGSAAAVALTRETSETAGQPTTRTSARAGEDICFMSAKELATLIRTKKISAREVMTAHLQRINRVNPKINAIVAKLDDGQCLSLAEAMDQRIARKEQIGPLHGLPIAFKDMQPAVGFPFTRGSTIYRTSMPTEDSVLVERLRKAGAIPIGKTNTPEFGMGSHTYNNVYGTTLNPFDQTKSAGGSSGGAGAALASGMLPIADGSDNAGSLRNPGNFNNIVGMRPTVGLVPSAPNTLPFLSFAVNGPMARTVSDTAFLLSVMAGADPRDPACFPSDPAEFGRNLNRSFRDVRVAWCPDLGGLPLDAGVRAILTSQRKTFEKLGCIVEDAVPDLTNADSIFLTIRSFRSATLYGGLLEQYRDQLKPEAVEEIERGLSLQSTAVAQAMVQHSQLLERMRRFQEKYEFILCAVNQVPPFDAKLHWPTSIDGVKMEHYIAWMKSAYWITATFRPAISVPAGFTTSGLPVGIQIVGRHRADFQLLQFAYAYEQETRVGLRHPSIA